MHLVLVYSPIFSKPENVSALLCAECVSVPQYDVCIFDVALHHSYRLKSLPILNQQLKVFP